MFVLDVLILVTICRGGMGITSTWAYGAVYWCRWGVGGCWWWCDSRLVAAGGGLGSFNSVVFVIPEVGGFALGGRVGFK